MSGNMTFIVIVTYENSQKSARPFIVRAGGLVAAYLAVIWNNQNAFDSEHIRLDGYVVDPEEMPDAKCIAKAWWTLAQENPSSLDFDALWDKHGADPESE